MQSAVERGPEALLRHMLISIRWNSSVFGVANLRFRYVLSVCMIRIKKGHYEQNEG